MTTFKRIVAATDLSEAARDACERAARIASSAGLPLDLVHVTQPQWLDQLRQLVSDPPEPLAERVLNAGRFGLEALAHELHQAWGVTAGLHATTGKLPEEIARIAGGQGTTLLVLGARGGSAARHLLLGSTAERMLAGAGDPMLVVRLAPEVHWRRVLVPVDFTPASVVALGRARALAPNARIVVLHAYEAPFEGKLRLAGLDDRQLRRHVQDAEQAARQQMTQLLAEAALAGPVESLVLHGHPVSMVLDQEEELGSQLLVVGKGSGSRVDDFLLGSVSRRLLAQSQADVLLST